MVSRIISWLQSSNIDLLTAEKQTKSIIYFWRHGFAEYPETISLQSYSVFEIVKPIEVQAGKIAPWFNQPGGGIQYMLPDTVDELLNPNVGALRRLQ